MRVLLFGRLSDVAGWRERTIDPPAASIEALRGLLARLDPALGEALAGRGVRVAVNRELVLGSAALDPRAEVAFMPPMSGG
jgi:sulfur-carrier protein